jgi:beta-RFAP synthase
MPRVIQVSAPSRLHFGLWSLDSGSGRKFGGVGAMVEQPRLQLSIQDAAKLEAIGPRASRSLAAARRWAEFHGRSALGCRIELLESPPEHVGLGSGTQLALAIAAGLSSFYELPEQTPQELALSVGRGLRSAVGTYGFLYGGLILEQGKLEGEPVSPLDFRIDLPDEWRFVLVRHADVTGLAGEDEASAMASLPGVPATVTAELIALARDRLVPAAATGNFPDFSTALHDYGRRSGECFAARQGGPYHGPILTKLVEQIRSLGHEGVGQSSWGPTLYVVTPDQDYAQRLANELIAAESGSQLIITIAPPANHGARIDVH